MPKRRKARWIPSREPGLYDNAIHGRSDYGEKLDDDEPEENVTARTRIWDDIAVAPTEVKAAFLSALSGRRRPLVGASAAVGVGPTGPSELPTIWFHGGMAYSVEGGSPDPIVVSREQHYVLQAFAKTGTAMVRGALETRAGIGNAPRALKQLVQRGAGRFRPAIRRPGTKRGEGYFARVLPFPGSQK